MEDLSKIKQLETELVKLRLKSRHIEFTNDYDRRTYSSKKHKTQNEIQDEVIRFLKTQNDPISNADLIKNLVMNIDDLSEYDFEKTTSGSIRIYSGIRTAIVNLAKKKIILIPVRGQIILNRK